MTSKIYPTLPNSTSIRGLKFEIVPESKETRCSFTIIDLDDAEHDDYEALSYAWGDPAPVTYATFEERGLRVGIAQNLADGLARLHKDGQKELIWIDAVCIDQQNVQERNQQVRLMGRIYSEATRVIIWLGLGENELMVEAFDLAKRCSNPVNDTSGGRETFETMHDTLLADLPPELAICVQKESPNFDATDELLTHVFSRPWFERLWVIQEAWLAKKYLVIAGENAAIDCNTLFWGTFWISRIRIGALRSEVVSFGSQDLDRFLRQFERRAFKGKMSLADLGVFEGYKTSEPRDYVYALLAITDIPTTISSYFVVDYERPVADVFKDATRGIIEFTRSLRVLQEASLEWTGSSSWARDWTLPRKESLDTYAYSLLRDKTAQVGKHERPDELILAGRHFGRVEHVRENRTEGSDDVNHVTNRIMRWYIWAREHAGKSRPGWFGLTEFDVAFAEIITGGRFALPQQNLAKFPNFDMKIWMRLGFYNLLLLWAKNFIRTADEDIECLAWAESILDEDNGVICLATNDGIDREALTGTRGFYYVMVAVYTSRRVLFRTDGGMFGMARGNVKVGDQLCVLYGGTVPFVLRKDDTGSHWRLVGTAYADPYRINDPVYWATGREGWFSLV